MQTINDKYAEEDATRRLLQICFRDRKPVADIEALLTRCPALINEEPGADIRLTKPLLSFAARCGHIPAMELLLERGADPTARDWGHIGTGKTALLHAADAGWLDAVKLMLRQPGVHIDEAGGAEEMCPQAVAAGWDEDEHKAEIHDGQDGRWNDDGWTALMHAAFYGDAPMVTALLMLGASTAPRSRHGLGAADLATGDLVPLLLEVHRESRAIVAAASAGPRLPPSGTAGTEIPHVPSHEDATAAAAAACRPCLDAIPPTLLRDVLRVLMQQLPGGAVQQACRTGLSSICLATGSDGCHLAPSSTDQIMLRLLTSLWLRCV